MPVRLLTTEALPGQPTRTGTTGRYRLRIITAGEGSSAHYSPEVLQQAAADRIFSRGTHMHLDHPTKTEERDRPVRSLKDLAAVFVEDAAYVTDDGGALDVDIQVAAPYQPLIEDIWEHIGASIHAFIEAEPAPGPGGKPVATRFVPDPRNTVDLVTKAGRGGRLIEALESAQAAVSEATTRERREQLALVLKATYAPQEGQYIWVRDFDETQDLVWFEDASERCWQQTFTPAEDDLSVTLAGDPIEVRPTTKYVPVTAPEESAGQSETTHQKEQKMPEISQARLDEITAIEARAAQLQTERDQAIERATAAEAERDTLTARQAHTAAVNTALEAVTVADPIKDRVRAVLEAHDGEITEQVVSEAVKAETEYLTRATEALGIGGIKGFGASNATNEAATSKRTHDAWGSPINSKEK